MYDCICAHDVIHLPVRLATAEGAATLAVPTPPAPGAGLPLVFLFPAVAAAIAVGRIAVIQYWPAVPVHDRACAGRYCACGCRCCVSARLVVQQRFVLIASRSWWSLLI